MLVAGKHHIHYLRPCPTLIVYCVLTAQVMKAKKICLFKNYLFMKDVLFYIFLKHIQLLFLSVEFVGLCPSYQL